MTCNHPPSPSSSSQHLSSDCAHFDLLCWNAVTRIWNHPYWIFLLHYACYVLISPLYFTWYNLLTSLHPSPLHYDMLASLGSDHYTFTRLVLLHLNSMHFDWLWSAPSDQIWPIHYSCSVSDLLNSDSLNISHSSLHCLLGLAPLAWICISLLGTFYFSLK